MEYLEDKLKEINGSDFLAHARTPGVKNGQGKMYNTRKFGHTRHPQGAMTRALKQNVHGNGRGMDDNAPKAGSRIKEFTEKTAEFTTLNKQGESASKAKGLINEMGSGVKQAISGADERKRLKEFGEPDLSGYSTAELRAMTERLNAESAYKTAAFPKETVKAKGMKATVDILSGLGGAAVTAVATWAIVQKLKGEV